MGMRWVWVAAVVAGEVFLPIFCDLQRELAGPREIKAPGGNERSQVCMVEPQKQAGYLGHGRRAG